MGDRIRKRGLAMAILACTLVSVAIGLVMVAKLVGNRPHIEATVDGLYLRLEHLQWLDDQMEHSEDYPMPASMMPDLPPHGIFRLNVEAALYNTVKDPRTFQVRELFLRSSVRGMWPASGGEVTDKIRLKEKQLFNVFASFDIAESEIDEDAKLQLLWIRDGKTVQMLDVPHPPDHFHDNPVNREEKPDDNKKEWPASVTGLPLGDSVKGRELFAKTYGCVSCHGHPKIEGSNIIGPHLGNVATHAADRVPNQNVAQYLYESILRPDAYIIEAKGQPAEGPSAMPPFAKILTHREAAHLVAYLVSLDGASN